MSAQIVLCETGKYVLGMRVRGVRGLIIGRTLT
jgi:hypothetical protein